MTAFMTAEKTRATAGGFTLLEVMLVVFIIAILLMMAVPNLAIIVPQAQLRGAARSTANLMQQARNLAENTKRPARLSLDCQEAPCVLQLHMAVINSDPNLLPNDPLKIEWLRVNAATRELGLKVQACARAVADDCQPGGVSPPPVPGHPAPDNLFWVIFLPTGRAQSSHDPMRLVFDSTTNSRVNPWALQVNKASGRPTLNKVQ